MSVSLVGNLFVLLKWALLVMNSLLVAGVFSSAAKATTTCTEVVFRDGFEIESASHRGGSLQATGTWLFSLDFTGSMRNFALELVERPSGKIAGYLLGGTSFRTFVDGSISGSAVAFSIELIHPTLTRAVSVTGSISENTVDGIATGDITTQPVTLHRTLCELTEQEFVAAQDSGGPEPEHIVSLSLVLDEENNLLAGGFVAWEDCDLWACDGGVTSFSEIGNTFTFGLETDGGCSAGSTFSATWDPSNIYTGTFSFTDCIGTSTGALIAAYGMRTSSRAAREVLNARSTIATALEAGVPLTGPLSAFSSGYLHFGKDEPALRAELNAEMMAFTGIEVDMHRTRELHTATHARTLDALLQPFGLKLDDIRSGIPGAGGPTRVVYRNQAVRPMIDDFVDIGQETGIWKISGNQVPALDLPFAFSIPPGGSRLEAPTADGNPNYISIGAYGTHFLPGGGDPSGESKANFAGFLVEGDSEMEELVGNGDGIRDPGETWGYPIGGDLTGDRIRQRRPAYITPLDGEVRVVIYEAAPTGSYFDNEPGWRVDIGFPGELQISFGHLGMIAAPLHDLILTTTGIDTDTFVGPVGSDLLDGHSPIAITTGTEIAFPQIFADPVPDHLGYYVGGGSFLEYPWAQIEFSVPLNLGGGQELASDFCIFRFQTANRRNELQAVMDTDMLDPTSLRYRDRSYTNRWQWSAEGGLCQTESALPRDFSDLYTRLGGWFERPEAGTTADELFSFVPIDKEAAAYNPSNYDSVDVSHLVIRHASSGPFSWLMPDTTLANPYFPVGEVIAQSDDELSIKWRDLNASNAVAYQRVAYRLDSAGLTLKWGNFAATPGTAVSPILLISDPCDDSTVLCHDHALGSWPP